MNSRVKEKNKIKKQLYELLKKKEKILKLIKHHNFLSKEEPYMDIDYYDLQYQSTTDISQLIHPIVIDKYYEPELIASAFDKNYERYQINGDKNKELSFNEYLNIVRANVQELIDKKEILGERKVH